MSKRFELLVFDWDGTVVDSTGHIARALQAACGDLGLPVPSHARARHVIGLGLRDAMHYLLPTLAPERYPELVERYRHHYLGAEHGIALFEGVTAAIGSFHDSGYLLAVATGKSRTGLDRALQQSGLARYFHASRCADEGFSKPHPQMLLHLIDLLGMAPERTLMIGDTTHDLEMARAAGVSSLAVTYGAHPRQQLRSCAPLACLESFVEVSQWIRTHG